MEGIKKLDWRRFELQPSEKTKLTELEEIVRRHNLSRRELAVIILTLRVRPGFGLKDFDI